MLRFLKIPTACTVSAIALLLASSCETTTPLLDSATSVPPALVGKQDYLLFESAFFTVPDDFDLLKKTEKNHVAGVFSPSDGAKLLAKLKRQRKIEVISTPNVTARQGQRAKIELIKEFTYPTEFNPPELGKWKSASESPSVFPVTPATPTRFDTKNLGITAEFEGRRASGGGVRMEFKIDQVNLLGLVNYGSPITTTGKDKNGRKAIVVLTENKIEQPVFAAKKLSSMVTIPNGHYLAVGGLRNDSQKSLDSRLREPLMDAATFVENDKNLFVLIKVTAVKP